MPHEDPTPRPRAALSRPLTERLDHAIRRGPDILAQFPLGISPWKHLPIGLCAHLDQGLEFRMVHRIEQSHPGHR